MTNCLANIQETFLKFLNREYCSFSKTFTVDDLYVVWFSKTLQNYKTLIYVPLLPYYYFEITYNGDKKETYIDTYKKIGKDIEKNI